MAAEVDINDLRATAAAYMRRPYARLLIPETDGTYRAEILEFPGCLATGDTPTEALEALEDVGASWVEGAIAKNQSIPVPVEESDFSGRIVVRMPKSLHKKAARMAERDGVSLNQFIVTGLAQYVGESTRSSQSHMNFNASITTFVNVLGASSNYLGRLGYMRFAQEAINVSQFAPQWHTPVRKIG